MDNEFDIAIEQEDIIQEGFISNSVYDKIVCLEMKSHLDYVYHVPEELRNDEKKKYFKDISLQILEKAEVQIKQSVYEF